MEEEFKKLLNSKLSINNGEYNQYIIHLTTCQIMSFYFKCNRPKGFKEGEKINLNYEKTKKQKRFCSFFLTKSQIKDVNKAKRDKTKYTLLPYKQLKKTCPDIIKINNKMEEFDKFRLQYQNKTSKEKKKKIQDQLKTSKAEKYDKAKKKMQDLFENSIKEFSKKEKYLTKIYENTLKKYMKPT